MRQRNLIGATMAAVVFSVCLVADVRAQGTKEYEKFRANAMIPGMVGTGATAVVDIKISRWTPEAERQELLAYLKQFGPERLHRELKRVQKVGVLAVRGERGYPLYYANQQEAGGKREIVLVTDREIDFLEVYQHEISLQYPFTIITMQVDADGEGKGEAIVGAEVVWDDAKNSLKITNYDAQPVRLEGIRRLEKK